MITHFHIENFKSLADFDLPPEGTELAGFTCLVGMNGAGKTTLLQAFDFTARLMTGRVKDWFAMRGWSPWDVRTRYGAQEGGNIKLAVELRLPDGRQARWEAEWDWETMRCAREKISFLGGESLLKFSSEGSMWIATDDTHGEEFPKIPFSFEGSVLSSLQLEGYHPALTAVKNTLQGLHSLELLSPHLIRRSSQQSDDIGVGGEQLTGFLSQLSTEQWDDLTAKIRSIYPQVESLRTQPKQFGWKGLLVKESGMGGNEVTEAHINDGFLRVLAMLSQAYTPHGILLLDEIENGINPAVAEKLMDFLVSLSRQDRQVIVTTHSPVILNYLEDDVAREGVILLFKTADGRTHSRRYFDIPENGQKLRSLGPGEVFLDTSIEALVDRLSVEESQGSFAS